MATKSPPNPPPAALVACPVKRLGERLAAVHAELARLDELGVGTQEGQRYLTEGGCYQRDVENLEDLQDHLEAQAQWLTPRSPEGLMLIAVLLPHAAGDAKDASHDTERRWGQYDRTFHRLCARLIEGLSELSGRKPEDLGLDRYWRSDLQWAGGSAVLSDQE